jgi:hypothetical protein
MFAPLLKTRFSSFPSCIQIPYKMLFLLFSLQSSYSLLLFGPFGRHAAPSCVKARKHFCFQVPFSEQAEAML